MTNPRWLLLAILPVAGCGLIKDAATAPKASAPVEYFKVNPAEAATLQGKVRFIGKRPPQRTISMDAEEACQSLHKTPVAEHTLVAAKDGALANVFVYVKAGLEGKNFEPPREAVMLDQRGCQFIPRVVALRAGQSFAVRNSDPVSHNIHPMPRNNRDWNQQQPPQSPDLQRKFAYPEVMIPVKCNVHAWMKTYIGVLDHPYFAVTGSDGIFRFPNLPPGQYTLAAWHELFGEQTQALTIDKKQVANADFTFR